MLTEGIFIRGLRVLALTPFERWEAARRYFKTTSEGRTWLIVSAAVALSIFVMFVFWIVDKFRHSSHHRTRAGQ